LSFYGLLESEKLAKMKQGRTVEMVIVDWNKEKNTSITTRRLNMSVTTSLYEADECADRVRQIKRLLFNNTTGNKYRTFCKDLTEKDELKSVARETSRVLIEAVFCDADLAILGLAKIARKREHGALIFIALDLAILSLMNPKLYNNHDLWVSDISSTFDAPIALVLRCLEYLTG